MDNIVLQATRRDVLRDKAGALRRQGKLPAVLYGHRIESTPITLDAPQAAQILATLTSSSLVTISLDGKEYPTLVREKQRHFLKNHLTHVDFQVLSLTEKMRVKVGIEFTGTAPAVKDFSAEIHHGLSEIEVECLPQDLPERFLVDISGLTEIGAAIHVRNLTAPDNVVILSAPDDTIAVVTATKAEAAVAAAAPEEPAPAEPEASE